MVDSLACRLPSKILMQDARHFSLYRPIKSKFSATDCPRRVELFDMWLIKQSDRSTKARELKGRERYAIIFKFAGGGPCSRLKTRDLRLRWREGETFVMLQNLMNAALHKYSTEITVNCGPISQGSSSFAGRIENT
jgi:hypothetical protein